MEDDCWRFFALKKGEELGGFHRAKGLRNKRVQALLLQLTKGAA
jgi:hypothetical protein